MVTGRAVVAGSPAHASARNMAGTWRPSPPTCARRACSLCHGTGWQLLSSGKVAAARRCSCRALQRLLEIREKARIPTRYEACTLDGYLPANPSQERALDEARRFVERYPAVSRGLLLVGPAGVGKTHLAVGIVRELLDRFEDDLLFCDFATLLRDGFTVARVRAGCALADLRLAPRAIEPASRWAGASLLIIDGFDAGALVPQWRDPMAALLARRFRARLPTIVSARSVSTALARKPSGEQRGGAERRAPGGALEALLRRLRRVSISIEGGAEQPDRPASLF